MASSFDTYCSWLFVWEIVIRTAHSLKHHVDQKAVLMDKRPLSAQSSFYSGYLIQVMTLEHLSVPLGECSEGRPLLSRMLPWRFHQPSLPPCLLSSWITDAAHALAYTWQEIPPISSFHPKLLLKHGTFSSFGLNLVWEYMSVLFLKKGTC